MNTKFFYYGILAILILLVILGNWGFLLGFVIAGAIFWYFGEEKVKKAVSDVYEKTQDLAIDLRDKVAPQKETLETIIRQSTIVPTDINSLYQIVIIAGEKSYLLKPLCITMVPQELSCGKTIKIITVYKRDGLEVEKKQTIETTDGMKYEIV